MTVKELIEELSKFDLETEVRIEGTDPTDWRYVNEIQGIRLGEGEEDEFYEKEYVLLNGGMF
jgi:hypothetical protein